MKKKYEYLFDKGKAFCEQDALGVLLDELRGKSVVEQLHSCDIRVVRVDNKDKDFGYIGSVFMPSDEEFLPRVRGFRKGDFPLPKNHFLVGINLTKHRRKHRLNPYGYWLDLGSTVGHEVAHSFQLDVRRHRRYLRYTGRLSIGMNEDSDEQFCDTLGDLWLSERGGRNYRQVKALLRPLERHGELIRIFPTHFETFTSG